ncbi:hypothetical protein BU14_0170s0001 [Porphyra umbilicalis]|uniref:Uncharacterized protein n=1 Tax=Porphyra umbilicalis TaxID=2786 RepID=A0A1X6P807_PORUM|nr:hypothetical protein BU14_0170s0001 [Porphyra umbilicalis]|eukprot:OSX76885.1 hypothetical protein BU14_0170s0001 [Porphyra umbilicalis]
MDRQPTSSDPLRDMMAAVADGERVLDVFARFSASTGFSISKVRTIDHNGRDELNKHNANYLLSATEEQALLYTTQALRYANFAFSWSQLDNLARSLWGYTFGTAWAHAWVAPHSSNVSACPFQAVTYKRIATPPFDAVK